MVYLGGKRYYGEYEYDFPWTDLTCKKLDL